MRVLFTICCFLWSTAVSAQASMAFTRLRTGDGSGLASNVVYSLFQDKKGFIWTGTANGLQRFDGSKFINLLMDKPGSDRMPSAAIAQIVDAGDGKMMFYMPTIREFGLFDPADFTYRKIKLMAKRPIIPRAQFRMWKTANG